ncbi:MAG: hypothetical protein QF732_03445 [Nitrospinaceae bacterium]|nr:hypothetical protein [Nitrospinaceae bacterium]
MSLERLRQHNFAKRVKFGAAAAAEAELRQVKQVELAPKRRLGPARALGQADADLVVRSQVTADFHAPQGVRLAKRGQSLSHCHALHCQRRSVGL